MEGSYFPSEDGPAIVLGIVLPYFRLSNPTHVRFFPPRQVPGPGLEQVPVLVKRSEMGNSVRKCNHWNERHCVKQLAARLVDHDKGLQIQSYVKLQKAC